MTKAHNPAPFTTSPQTWGIAYHAKPAVAAAAAARIDPGDLTALLYAQGYRREELAGT